MLSVTVLTDCPRLIVVAECEASWAPYWLFIQYSATTHGCNVPASRGQLSVLADAPRAGSDCTVEYEQRLRCCCSDRLELTFSEN